MTNKTGLNGRKKVLIVLDTLRRGGIEIAALRFCRLLKSDDYECTFLVRKGENMDESMVGEIADIGAEIITKPSAADNYIKDYFFLLKTMKDGKYDIVHSHLLFYNGIVMRTAYKAGVRKRIAQSHATQDNRSRSRIKKFATDIYKRIMQRWLKKYATDLVGCSEKAGVYMCSEKLFEKRGYVLPNYVDSAKYEFSPQRRAAAREKLGLSDELIIGHVGSIYWIKNQTFLVSLLAELLKTEPNSRLMLVGDERDDGETRALAEKLGVSDKVIFTGSRDDIPDLLNAMDVFVFPSRFEALPIAPIEAQAASLPCVTSLGVPEEIKVNAAFERISLDEPASLWIEKICEFLKLDRAAMDLSGLRARYSAESVREKLLNLYSL